MVQLRDYNRQRSSDHNYAKCALYFSVWLVLPDMISLSDGPLTWHISSFDWMLHASEFAGSPSDLLGALKNCSAAIYFRGKRQLQLLFFSCRTTAG